MAIQEYEPQPGKTPLDFFKDSLHGMVVEVESTGVSALNSLLIIRTELRRQRVDLMHESNTVEQQLRIDYSDGETMRRFSEIQEELIMIYHKLVWVEGYARDRLPQP